MAKKNTKKNFKIFALKILSLYENFNAEESAL